MPCIITYTLLLLSFNLIEFGFETQQQNPPDKQLPPSLCQVVYNATELDLPKSHILQGVSGRFVVYNPPYQVGFSKRPRFTGRFWMFCS
jgi:hypothetical protein